MMEYSVTLFFYIYIEVVHSLSNNHRNSSVVSLNVLYDLFRILLQLTQ